MEFCTFEDITCVLTQMSSDRAIVELSTGLKKKETQSYDETDQCVEQIEGPFPSTVLTMLQRLLFRKLRFSRRYAV